MATRTQKIRLGAFALMTAALLVTVLAVFAGVRVWKDLDSYTVVYEGSVLGLEVGADVRLNGVRVGKVTDIDIDEGDLERVHIDLELEEGTPVRADTEAILAFRGITGLKIIDLRRGSSEAPPLPPGSNIAVGETFIDQLERESEELVARTKRLMEGASALVESLQRASSGLEGMIAENRVAIRGSVASIGRAADTVSRFVDRDAKKLTTGANGLVADMAGVVRDSQGQIKAALVDMRRASASMKELARDLRQKPSRLLFSQAPKDRKLP
jgi:phospholipid/cholesterol/gamma-HCH transport system substrate-binding protein